jgi:hypothetical protein
LADEGAVLEGAAASAAIAPAGEAVIVAKVFVLVEFLEGEVERVNGVLGGGCRVVHG